jgi:cytochrome c oxidase subunit 3
MWLFLAAVTMVFAGFVSAYVVRRGMSNDWRPIAKPPILWANTAILLASSLTLERARRLRDGAPVWLGVTSLLGALFLIGQAVAWQQLRAAGVYLASNPSSSFFYLLTGAHGLHLVGGVAALFYVAVRSSLQGGWKGRPAAVGATALYWHFMDGLWLFVFLLVFVWR